MKNIEDYKNTNTDIYVETKEEYEALIPLLNTIWNGWRKESWSSYCKDNEHYIHINSDSIGKRRSDNAVISAKEFIGPKEEIINNYLIY